MTLEGGEQTTCAFHPTRPATLRCNRCGKPICVQCAVLTPVGYRCKECVRGQQKAFETARWYDFVIAFAVSAVLAGLGSLLVFVLGFFIFLIAPAAGMVVAEVVRRAVGRRRSRLLPLAAGLGAAAGCIPGALGPLTLSLISLLTGGSLGALAGGLLGLLYPAAYAVLLIGSLVASLRGIRL